MALTNAERVRRYRERHPDRVKASSDKYRASHPERTAESLSRWRKAHPEAVREQHVRQYWSRPDVFRERARRGVHGITLNDLVALKGSDCGICGEPIDLSLRGWSSGAPTIDHIVPRVLGGTNDIDNLQPAHFGCNRSKDCGKHRPAE